MKKAVKLPRKLKKHIKYMMLRGIFKKRLHTNKFKIIEYNRQNREVLKIGYVMGNLITI